MPAIGFTACPGAAFAAAIAAAKLAGDPAALSELRAGLRARLRASPLLDGAALARNMDKAYRGIWRDWCRSRI